MSSSQIKSNPWFHPVISFNSYRCNIYLRDSKANCFMLCFPYFSQLDRDKSQWFSFYISIVKTYFFYLEDSRKHGTNCSDLFFSFLPAAATRTSERIAKDFRVFILHTTCQRQFISNKEALWYLFINISSDSN